jgi:clan AA aspartic protease (TIGR02281 family)
MVDEMKIPIRSVALLFVLTLPSAIRAAPDPQVEAILTSKGLTRVGLYYLLPGDVSLRDKLRATRAAKAQLDLAMGKRTSVEKTIRSALDALEAAEAQEHDLGSKMERVGTNATGTYNLYVRQSNDLELREQQLRQYIQDREFELTRFIVPTEQYVTALNDTFDSMEPTAAQYDVLTADPKIKDALSRLNAKATAKYRLGPSPDFATNLPLIRKEQALVLSAAVKFSNTANVPQLEAVFNGKLRVTVVFDSGASMVSVPWEIAQKLGIAIASSNKKIESKLANGKIVKGTLATLESLQVGPFVVRDVECEVGDPSEKGGLCLLGGSFLRYFIYRMDLAGGQVFMTQVRGNPTATTASSPRVALTKPPDPASVARAISVLESKPNDGTANLVVGRYSCFVKGEWTDGLPLLAKSSDVAAKKLAVEDLKKPSDAEAQLALADGWWAYADSQQGSEKVAIQVHAQDLYRKALPGLKGLEKLEAQTRLGFPTSQPAAPPAVATVDSTPGSPAGDSSAPLPVGEDFRELLPSKTWKHPGQQRDDGLVAFGGVYNLETPESFKPPAIFRFVVQPVPGVKISIRPQYDNTHLELEASSTSNRILVVGGPAKGVRKDGVGEIPSGVWTTIDMIVEPDVLIVVVDGKERFRTEADFSQSNGPFRLHSIKEGGVLVKSIQVGKLRGATQTSVEPSQKPEPADGFVEVLPQMHGAGTNVDGIVSYVHGTELLEKRYHPPVEFRVVAQGGSDDIRFAYGQMVAIFNWKDDPTLLRFEHAPPGIDSKKGAGLIDPGKWTTFDLIYEPHSMTIRVDGQERFHADAEIDDSDPVFKIMRSARDSLLQIKSVQVGKPRESGRATTNKPNQLPTPGGQREFTNSLGMKFVRIDPGTFQMGSLESEPQRKPNEVQHTVALTKPYYMACYLVTRGQFSRFVNETHYVTVAEKAGHSRIRDPQKQVYLDAPGVSWRNAVIPQEDDHPVVLVSWHDAQAFVAWLSQKEGSAYRLPTEAEWEFACRNDIHDTNPFNTGMTINADQANFNAEHPYNNGSPGLYRKGTTKVGTFPSNARGIYDMHGNVQEWCYDVLADYPMGEVTDPTGPPQSDTAPRVLRGGSWNDYGPLCRSAFRYGVPPGHRDNLIGFRIVLDTQGEKAGPVAPKNPEGKGLFGPP